MPRVEFIYFDLGKVILDFDHDLACRQMAEVANVTAAEVRSSLFNSDLQVSYETGLITSDQFYRQFCLATESTPEKHELLSAGSDIFSVNQAVLSIIEELTALPMRLGILSNTCEAHWDFILSRFPVVRELFELKILSFEVNSMKPDGRIYEQAILRAGVSAEAIFFMDDRLENVAGAVAAGIDAVLFRSAKELADQLRERDVPVHV
jgi:putative hydrolase of the HAD superfamily